MNNKGFGIPLYRELYEDLRTDICREIYLPGELLPPIREMAKRRGVARNTVESAYQMLAEEGFVSSRRGVGYMVLDICQSFNSFMKETISEQEAESIELFPALTAQTLFKEPCNFDDICVSENHTDNPLICDFRKSKAPADLFPPKIWHTLANRLPCAGVKTNEEYTERELCAYIRRFLKKHRGIDCREEQIFLCRDMCEANRLIRMTHAQVLYAIPHHGGQLENHINEEETQVYLNKIKSRDIFLMEDDLDSELVHNRRPYPAIYNLDKNGKVIYTGTFDRLLGPWLMTQYVVFPECLLTRAGAMVKNYGMMQRYSELEKAALMCFMQTGDWENFLRKANRRNTLRRDVLIREMRENFGDEVVLHRTEAGMEIIASFPGSKYSSVKDVRAFSVRAENAGLGISARSGADRATGKKYLYLTMSYGSLTEEVIVDGVRILKGLF